MTIKSILVLGSGPIKIGQAAEFDYAGSQACKALHEEGYRVILLNSNPATIQTDTAMADIVYIKPLTAKTVEAIVKEHHPKGVIATLGGQTALNLCVECEEKGIWREFGVKVLGTPTSAIKTAEGRESFKELMKKIGQPVPASVSASSVDEALEFACSNRYPLIIRPDYTLGGTGGGVAKNEEELKIKAKEGLEASPVHKILVEEYLSGWREFEFEVMRDSAGNALCVCGMENVDPMGIHTGDSIVVSPIVTLSDFQRNRLRSAALAIVEALDVRGACNVQFALSPDGDSYYVIEVNPRASRSSALASKATGYPIARIAAKIAVGKGLAELPNPITGKGNALSEPKLDYIVVKHPRWPFEKFPTANIQLGTQMKSTGEVMAIGSSFMHALLKAFRSLDAPSPLTDKCFKKATKDELWQHCTLPTHRRMGAILELLRRGKKAEEISGATAIHPYFIKQLQQIISIEKRLKTGLTRDVLAEAKGAGFSDEDIACICEKPTGEIAGLRQGYNIEIKHRKVGGEASLSGYFYGVYEDDVPPVASPAKARSIIVLGSGPIRIAQGVEFDYCCVKAVESLRRRGFRAVMANNNPETVSTDHDISDALYFEPLHVEDVRAILKRERAEGFFCSFGGQTSLKLGLSLAEEGYNMFGTGASAIVEAEDRGRFCDILHKLDIPYPPGEAARDLKEAVDIAEGLGFPVMIRPSFVIGGVDMQVVYEMDDFRRLASLAFSHAPGVALLIDRFLQGKEFEADAVCDGKDVLIPGIFEHLDPAGVHSGDSIALFPDFSLLPQEKGEVLHIVSALSEALSVKGLFNVQFVRHDGKLFVIEANPRASRTVPIASKLTEIPMVDLAVGVALGESLKDAGYGLGILDYKGPLGVKVPVFSTEKLPGADSRLGPQMQSTGESLGVGETFAEALREALQGAGWKIPEKGNILFSVRDDQKSLLAPVASIFYNLGWEIYATPGTAAALKKWGLPSREVPKGAELISAIRSNMFDVIVNIPSLRANTLKDGYAMRRAAIESQVLCLHTLEAAQAVGSSLTSRNHT